jgi:hypothetical protein
MLAVGNGLPVQEDADMTRAFAHMNPVTRVALNRHALLNDVTFHGLSSVELLELL